jgi:hypothetical protein
LLDLRIQNLVNTRAGGIHALLNTISVPTRGADGVFAPRTRTAIVTEGGIARAARLPAVSA